MMQSVSALSCCPWRLSTESDTDYVGLYLRCDNRQPPRANTQQLYALHHGSPKTVTARKLCNVLCAVRSGPAERPLLRPL
jgi:hypothetical protein